MQEAAAVRRAHRAPTLHAGVSTGLFFVPAEKTIPRVRITTRQAATLAGKRIVVAIDTWERTARSPQGHYVKVWSSFIALHCKSSPPLDHSTAKIGSSAGCHGGRVMVVLCML